MNIKLVFIFLLLSFVAKAESEWVDIESAKRAIKITGFTRAQAKMPLISEVSGKVTEVFSDIGGAIPETGKFACLDDTFTVIDIKSARNEISQHNIDIKYFKKQVSRHKQLVNKQTSAVSVLDGLERDLGNAKQALYAAAIRKQRLQELKDRHCVKAHAGWLVIDRNIEPGQWVNQGDVIAEVGDYSQLKIPISLSEQELLALKQKKDQLEVNLTDNGYKVGASIKHISPSFDEKSRKVLVDLLLEKNSFQLHGGMRVELDLNISTQSNTFAISKRALEERFEEYFIHRKDGKRIRVKLLKYLANEKASIQSSEIKPGNQFKIIN